MKLNWNFLGGGVQDKEPSVGGVMDIFWNCTLLSVYHFLVAFFLGGGGGGLCDAALEMTPRRRELHII